MKQANDDNQSLSSLNREVVKWIALRTSARWEKQVARDLFASNVPVFLPLLTRAVQYSTRRNVSVLPLFPGYVFCSELHFIGNQEAYAAGRKYVAQILRPPDYFQLRDELLYIYNVIKDHELVQECVYGKPGHTVRVMSGSMAGHEGVLTRLDPGRRTLFLEISFLGSRVEVEMDERIISRQL